MSKTLEEALDRIGTRTSATPIESLLTGLSINLQLVAVTTLMAGGTPEDDALATARRIHTQLWESERGT